MRCLIVVAATLLPRMWSLHCLCQEKACRLWSSRQLFGHSWLARHKSTGSEKGTQIISLFFDSGADGATPVSCTKMSQSLDSCAISNFSPRTYKFLDANFTGRPAHAYAKSSHSWQCVQIIRRKDTTWTACTHPLHEKTSRKDSPCLRRWPSTLSTIEFYKIIIPF